MALSSADLSHPVSAALDAWWAGPAASDAPAVVLGPDGVGKTQATLAWLVDRVDDQQRACEGNESAYVLSQQVPWVPIDDLHLMWSTGS